MQETIPNPNSTLLTASDPMRQKMARHYALKTGEIGVLTMVTCLLPFLLFLTVPQTTIGLRNWAESISSDPVIVVALYVLPLALFLLLVSLPGDYKLQFQLLRRYGQITISAGAWWIAYVRSCILTLARWIAIAEVFYWIARTFPDTWWLIVAALSCTVALLTQYFSPHNRLGTKKLAPLSDAELVQRLDRLTEQVGGLTLTMWILPTTEKVGLVNAWLVGMGQRRRMVLTSALLENFNYDELEAIVAHELAHHVHGDIPKKVALDAAGKLLAPFLAYVFIALFAGYALLGNVTDLGGASDVATLPYVLLAYLSSAILLAWIDGSRSHKAERAADRYAMELTGNSAALKSAMVKIADLNLLETNPTARTRPVWASHPTTDARIEAADLKAGINVPQPVSPPGRQATVRSSRVRYVSIASYYAAKK